MPSIWNVNNGYGAGNKKISSKLTFEVGEKFAGRISSNSDDGSVFVKLTDGWEFPAELQKNNLQIGMGLMQFQVVGYDGDKIKLAVVKNSLEQDKNIDDNLKEFASSEGIDSEDVSLLKSMIEHDIPLTKDNIVFVKSLMNFNKKINDDSEEKSDFISKYIASKGIDENSEEGANIKNLLNSFFDKYQGMSKDEILLFLENNIDINEENIDSFNKLFKGDQTIKDILDDIKTSFDNISSDELINTDNITESKINSNTEDINQNEDAKSNTVNKSVASKAYEANASNKSKLNVIGFLKSLAGNDNDILKQPLRDILGARSSTITNSEFKNINSKIEMLSDEQFLNNILGKNDNSINVSSITKETIQKTVSELFGKQIEITDDEVLNIKNYISAKLGDVQSLESVSKGQDNSFINNNQKIIIDYDKFNQNINQILDSRKNAFHGELRQNAKANIENLDQSKIQNIIKHNLNKYNIITKESFNSILSDLFGKDVNLIKEEVSALSDCITAENLKQDDNIKNIQPRNVNNIYNKYEEALKNNKDVKQLLKNSLEHVKSNYNQKDMDTISKKIDNMSNEKLGNIIKEEMIKSQDNIENRIMKRLLTDKAIISKENYNIIKNSKSPREMIQGDLKLKIDDMKETVKQIIQKTSSETLLSDKIMQLINSNINDFKVFNSLSNEYYYLDVPVSANQKEYPCKLIIKDKRQDNKKIDKTSIKMVVAIKTVNLGNVDGYLYVRNNKIDVNIKCEKKYMKLLSIAKNKLEDRLNAIGFTSDVTVSENKQQVNLATCREFFNNDNIRRIDTKV